MGTGAGQCSAGEPVEDFSGGAFHPRLDLKRSAVASNLVMGDPPVVSYLGEARLSRRVLSRPDPVDSDALAQQRSSS